ncbi:MAG: NAD(+) diphosphatase [Pseudomonadota bacterium]
MRVDFNTLEVPEPSSLVGFSQNHLIRDAEHRTEETIKRAFDHPEVSFYLFAGNRVLLKKEERSQITFDQATAEQFGPDRDAAILLGETGGAPQIAIPCSVDPEILSAPWTSYDLRSLLYSSSVAAEQASVVAQAGSILHWHSMNKYCGRCGALSQSKIGGYRRDCPSCEAKIFPRTDPVVIMLPVQGERCVMGRSPHFPPGWYSTLAGFVEPGETIEDAVRRETFEESGIEIARVRYHASQPWPFPHSLMIGIHCEATSDTITMDESELEDCRWFTREDVKMMMNETHPDGIICPPNKAISSALIQYWANDQ